MQKYRFDQLLESELGNVKPLLMESTKANAGDIQKFLQLNQDNTIEVDYNFGDKTAQAVAKYLLKAYPESKKYSKVSTVQQLWQVMKENNNDVGLTPGFGPKMASSVARLLDKAKTQIEKNKKSAPKKKAILNKKLPSNLDLHIYAALRFAKLNSSPLTESELRSDTIQTLSEILCEKSKRMKTCDPSMWSGKDPKGNDNKNYLGYLDYSSLYSKSPEYDPSFKKSSFSYSQPRPIKELMLTLGQASVKKQGDNWVVSDTYNFDNILKSKPWLKMSPSLSILHGIAVSVYDLVRGKAPVAGAEEILSQYHNFGFEGYKTQLTIPMGNCKCGKN